MAKRLTAEREAEVRELAATAASDAAENERNGDGYRVEASTARDALYVLLVEIDALRLERNVQHDIAMKIAGELAEERRLTNALRVALREACDVLEGACHPSIIARLRALAGAT